MAGRRENVRGRAGLDDCAREQERHPVADLRHDAKIVGHEDDRGPMRLLHLANEPQDLFLHRHVERRCRLVGDDDLGLERESRGDQDALAHAAGQLVRIGAQHALRVSDMHFGEQFERARVRLARVHSAAEPQAVGQLRLDAPAGVERGHRVLGHERDGVAEDRARLAPRHRSQVPPFEQDFASRDPDRARQHAEQRLGDRRFAGAAFADEPERFAGRKIEAHIPQDRLSVPEFRDRAQAPNGEDRRRHRLSTGSSARRNPSPSWLKASTVANSAASGAANTHQV